MKINVVFLIIAFCLLWEISFSQHNWTKGKNVVAIECLVQETNQDKILKSTNIWDSCVFVSIGGCWVDGHGLMGIGYLNDNLYKLEIIFKRDYSSKTYCELKIQKIKSKKIRNEKTILEIKDFNTQKLLSLNNDSLKLKTRTETVVSSSHSDYTVLIETKMNHLELIHLYDAKYYQSNAPTEERKWFLEEINRLIKLLNN